MKWFPGPDYHVQSTSLARDDADAEATPTGEYAAPFREMYSLWILDSSLDIRFVPRACHPNHLAETVEAQGLEAATRQAVIHLLGQARMIVMPDGALAGTCEDLLRPGTTATVLGVRGRTDSTLPCFYVHPSSFEAYLDELDLIAHRPLFRPNTLAREAEWERYTSLHRFSVPRAAIAHLDVIRFLDDVILSSAYLTERERRWVGR